MMMMMMSRKMRKQVAHRAIVVQWRLVGPTLNDEAGVVVVVVVAFAGVVVVGVGEWVKEWECWNETVATACPPK